MSLEETGDDNVLSVSSVQGRERRPTGLKVLFEKGGGWGSDKNLFDLFVLQTTIQRLMNKVRNAPNAQLGEVPLTTRLANVTLEFYDLEREG